MNIAQLKIDVANGVMIGRETWKQLVEWAYERRHVEPNEANFHRLVKHCGLSKKQEGYVMGAYRQSFDTAPRENLPGTGPHVSVGIKLDPAYIAFDNDSVRGSGPFVPLVAPAAPAVDSVIAYRLDASGIPKPVTAIEVFNAVVPAPTDNAHINPANQAAKTVVDVSKPNAILRNPANGYIVHATPDADMLDQCLPRYGIRFATIVTRANGEYYKRDDVLSLFGCSE